MSPSKRHVSPQTLLKQPTGDSEIDEKQPMLFKLKSNSSDQTTEDLVFLRSEEQGVERMESYGLRMRNL